MNWSTRERDSWQKGWSPTWPQSPLVRDPVRARHSLRFGAAFRAPKTVPRKVHPRNLSEMMCSAHRSCCHVHDVMQNSKWLFEAVGGMPTMNIPGFTLQHARTVASCASSSVKSHVSSNKATPRKGLDWRFRCSDTSHRYIPFNGQAHPARNPTSSVRVPSTRKTLQEC